MKQSKWSSVAIVAALVVAVAVVMSMPKSPKAPPPGEEAEAVSSEPAQAAGGLPRLVDLGADKCIPCKMMAPILEELKREQAGKVEVEFIDVWKNPGAGQQYGIQTIPTQIFYNAQGKEIFRHQGFFAKDEILAVFKKHGIAVAESPAK